jgi:glycosyltransferase involved in cell wall biosynthesis
MLLSVVIPAFNEALYLPKTLTAIRRAAAECRCGVELVVVDNASNDRTAEIALSLGATVTREEVHNVARVRNTGARAATGDVLLFLDADTVVPPEFLDRIAGTMTDDSCIGGTPDIVHELDSRILDAYFRAWRWLGRKLDMAQGAAQFCRASEFHHLNGYDESQFMGEDVDFYWRLRKRAVKTGSYLKRLDDVQVSPSPRRFKNAPLWRTLLWTNPLFIAPLRRTRSAWNAWYVRPPR